MHPNLAVVAITNESLYTSPEQNQLFEFLGARPATAAVAVTDATARIEAMTTPSICQDQCSKVCTAVTR